MVDIGLNIANNLKAKNFLGTLSIRNGLFFIAIQQFLLGVSLYSILQYLHPSMTKLAWLLFGINAISAVLGFFGALKRNMVIESVYLVFYFVSLLLVLLTVLDMAELVHLLPKAPELHNLSHFGTVRSASFLRAGHMKPYSFIKHRDIPLGITDGIFNNGIDENLEVDLDSKNGVDSTVSTDAEDMVPSQIAGPIPAKSKLPISSSKIDVNNQMLSEDSMQKQRENGTISQTVNNAAPATNVMPNETTGIREVTNSALRNAKNGIQQVDKGSSKANVTSTEAEQAAAVKELNTAIDDEASKNVATENKDGGSVFDNIPLVPHLGETEGEAEEVSKEELPPETRDLSPEGVSEVVALYKIQKRPLKMAAAGLITMSLLFNIYCYWVAVTFVLNKCTCLDELVSHPEQFTPLID